MASQSRPAPGQASVEEKVAESLREQTADAIAASDQPEEVELTPSPSLDAVYAVLLEEGASQEQIEEELEKAAIERAKTLLSGAKLSSSRLKRGILDWPDVGDTKRMSELLGELTSYISSYLTRRSRGTFTDTMFDTPFGKKAVRLYGIATVLRELSNLRKLDQRFETTLRGVANDFFSIFSDDKDTELLLQKMDENITGRALYGRLKARIDRDNRWINFATKKYRSPI